MIKNLSFLFFATVLFCNVFAEQNDSLPKEYDSIKNELFGVDMEYRPRAEIRNGFRTLRSDTSLAAFFISHRARLNLNYKKEKFAAAFSAQDVRTWGATDPRFNGGNIQVFEAWAEPFFTKELSLRIGKQRFMLDNQRLFAQNDWRNNGGTHDAANFIYTKNNLESQLLFAWNQSSESNFYTNYNPTGFTNYKSLLVSFFKWKSANNKFFLTTINYYEGFQYLSNNVIKKTEHQNFRYTNGGRIEYTAKKLYLTLSGYYQWGHNQAGKKLAAFYFQPELKYTLKESEIKLGLEYKSGNNTLVASDYDNAFQYPYGVAHRFNGTMEYFASGYPGSQKDVGLINPYLFVEQKMSKAFSVSLQNHLFFSQWKVYDAKTKVQAPDNYFGFESDLLATYRPNNFTKIDIGVSTLLASKSLEFISNGSRAYLPYWGYLQVTFKPKLLSVKK